ncbi:MAG: Gfo/Idh/MocA family oxidoreductase [Phycisphaeraceae bacterium]
MKTAAVIGCGRVPAKPVPGHKVGWSIGYAHGQGYREAFPQVELYAVDPSADNLAAFGEKHGIPASRRFASAEALYAAVTPEAVSICTWPGLHIPLARQAVERGVKAIAVEKPLGVNGAEIHEFMDLSQRKGARVAVAHQRRYEPAFVKAREMIQQGMLGERLVVEARVGGDWDILSWTVHWFDMANFLFDATPQWVLAGIDHQGERRYGHAVENASVIVAQYPGSRQAMFITGPEALPQGGVTVRGERGLLEIADSLKLWTTEGYREVAAGEARFASAFAAMLYDLWQSVGASGASGEAAMSRCDIRRCAVATQMAYAAHESARTQRRVALPLHTWFAPLEVMQHPVRPERTSPWRIALLADVHCDWPGMHMSGRDGLHDALVALGHEVTLLDATAELEPDALARTDLLVIYHTQRATAASHRAVLTPWFAASRPVVISHCGIGAYADWPEYRRWIGRYWVWGDEACADLPASGHPHVPCTLRVDDPQRFALSWREAWLPTDEFYQTLGAASDVRTLVTASTDGHEQAYAWQVVEHPHVVVWLPGHRADMFALAAVRDGLAASLALAMASARATAPAGAREA